MSTNTNLLSPENVKHLYMEGADKHECKYFDCRNKETTNTRHKKCGKCSKVKYCSRECQIADWPRHKPTCRAWQKKMLDDKNSSTNEKDGFKRVATFTSKYGPLLGSIAQDLSPSKSNRKGTIAILHLKDLPEHCISRKMEIESIGCVDIKDIPGDVGTQCLQSVNRERKLVQDRGKDPNDVICVHIFHEKTSSFMVVPFVFHDEKDSYKGLVGAGKTAIDQYCNREVERIVRTINLLARGESNDLKSAKKCPSGPKENKRM